MFHFFPPKPINFYFYFLKKEKEKVKEPRNSRVPFFCYKPSRPPARKSKMKKKKNIEYLLLFLCVCVCVSQLSWFRSIPLQALMDIPFS